VLVLVRISDLLNFLGSWKQSPERKARDLKWPRHFLPLSHYSKRRLIQSIARIARSPCWIRRFPPTYA
jgi:hypothetical protein